MLSIDEKEKIRQYLEKLFGQKVEKTEIKSITVNPPYHGQGKRTIEVNHSYADLEPGRPPDKVLAIFKSRSFLICTAERGARKGMPYIFTRDTIISVEVIK